MKEREMNDEVNCTIEYINESELGENYMQNYLVEYDNVKNEYYIMDFTQKYKYIIVAHAKRELSTHNYMEYGYVDESELKSLDTKKLAILKDNHTNEYYIQDYEKPNKKWIVLVNDWNSLDNVNYVSEEDIDPLEWTIHLDSSSNKKYIIDESTNESLYVIPRDYLNEFRTHWNEFYKYRVRSSSLDMDRRRDEKSQIQIDYVNHEELESVDLLHAKILKDLQTNEYYIVNPLNTRHRWIILPKSWHKKSKTFEPYMSEEDALKDKSLKVHTEEDTRRKYVYDANKNKIFLIPKSKDPKQSFKHKWTEITRLLNENKMKKSNDPMKIIDLAGSPRPLHHMMIERAIDKKKKPSLQQHQQHEKHQQLEMQYNKLDKKKSSSNDFLDKTYIEQIKPQTLKQQQQQKKYVCFNEKVEIKDYELNETLMKEQHTERVKHNDENVIRLKQKGRMGHTIRPAH